MIRGRVVLVLAASRKANAISDSARFRMTLTPAIHPTGFEVVFSALVRGATRHI
jgi:hypothetical protein